MIIIEKYYQIEKFINQTQFDIYVKINENNTEGPKVEIKQLDEYTKKFQNKLEYIEGIMGGISSTKSKTQDLPTIKNIREFIYQFRKSESKKKKKY